MSSPAASQPPAMAIEAMTRIETNHFGNRMAKPPLGSKARIGELDVP
jgi:hypothetical protein